MKINDQWVGFNTALSGVDTALSPFARPDPTPTSMNDLEGQYFTTNEALTLLDLRSRSQLAQYVQEGWLSPLPKHKGPKYSKIEVLRLAAIPKGSRKRATVAPQGRQGSSLSMDDVVNSLASVDERMRNLSHLVDSLSLRSNTLDISSTFMTPAVYAGRQGTVQLVRDAINAAEALERGEWSLGECGRWVGVLHHMKKSQHQIATQLIEGDFPRLCLSLFSGMTNWIRNQPMYAFDRNLIELEMLLGRTAGRYRRLALKELPPK